MMDESSYVPRGKVLFDTGEIPPVKFRLRILLLLGFFVGFAVFETILWIYGFYVGIFTFEDANKTAEAVGYSIIPIGFDIMIGFFIYTVYISDMDRRIIVTDREIIWKHRKKRFLYTFIICVVNMMPDMILLRI